MAGQTPPSTAPTETSLSQVLLLLAQNWEYLILSYLLVFSVLLIMTQPNDGEGIATLLNHSLQPKGITAKVSLKDGCLQVMLGSDQAPEPELLIAFILMEIISLGVTSIRKVKFCGWQVRSFAPPWHREFELEEHVDSSAPASALEVTTEIQTSNRVSESEFKDALKECAATAKKAYQSTLLHYNQVAVILQELKKSLDKTASGLLSDKDAANFDFASVLKKIVAEIERQAGEGLKELKKSIDNQSQHLEDFTIVLFGRTKAGKSTIREALTCGDGNTIGTGSQRTTRDVREYRWKGLRLIDTPGIEAYKGEEDRQKALEIVYESDMVIFLASDDSVQPGEFDAMAWLKEINKYFFVLLNVKYDLESTKRFERFLKKPEKVFEPQRLAEHKQHISTYVKDSLGIEQVDIICIQALAAFLSTQPQYVEHSRKLWELSRIEEAYSLITSEIKNRGSQRRWNTFFDGVIYFVEIIEKMLDAHQRYLKEQSEFMLEKRGELKNIFTEHTERGKLKVERQCEDLFSKIKEWIPNFVDEYLGKDNAPSEYQRRMEGEKTKIEETMKGLFKEIVNDLVTSLSEFQRQYQYDMGTLKVEPPDLSNFREWQVGKALKWVGVGLGAAAAVAWGIGAFAAANFWNPVGWVAGIASAIVGFFSWRVREKEKEAWRKAKQEAKETLWKSIDKTKEDTCKAYKNLLNTNLSQAQKEILAQVDTYKDRLSEIADITRKYLIHLEQIREKMNERKNSYKRISIKNCYL